MNRRTFLTALVGLVPAAALAQDKLYAPPPPPGSAFVRALGAGAWRVGGTTMDPQSRYQAVPSGSRAVQAGQTALGSAVLEAGRFYTVARAADGALLTLADDPHTELTRAGLRLINLSACPTLSLVSADGALTVLADVASGRAGYRPVNPVAIALAVRTAGGVLQPAPPVRLRAGGSVTVWARGPADAPVLTVVEDAVVG